MTLTGCSSKTVINPISGTDIYVNENNDTCMSDEYLEKVLKVKISE